MRYMWWAEFQKRGALHYHALIVDAPFRTEGEALRWFTDHWRAQLPPGVFRAQPDIHFEPPRWFRRRAGAYVLKDVRKIHGKTYQQDYSRMPRGWRTFRTHQLAFVAAEHQEHETKALTVCTARLEAPWYERRHDVWVYRVDHHVPAVDGCRLYRRRTRARVAASRSSERHDLPGNGGHDVFATHYSLVAQRHTLTGQTYDQRRE